MLPELLAPSTGLQNFPARLDITTEAQEAVPALRGTLSASQPWGGQDVLGRLSSLPFPSTWVGSSGRDKGGVPVSRPCLEAQPIKSPRGWPRVWDRQWGPGVLVALVSFLPRVAVCLCSPSHFPLLFSASGHCVWLVIGLWYPIFPLLVSFSLLASLLCIYCQPFP